MVVVVVMIVVAVVVVMVVVVEGAVVVEVVVVVRGLHVCVYTLKYMWTHLPSVVFALGSRRDNENILSGGSTQSTEKTAEINIIMRKFKTAIQYFKILTHELRKLSS